MDCPGDRVFAVEIFWTLFTNFCHLPPPPSASRQPNPLATLAQNWCVPPKNNLKWPEINQVTHSKLYYYKVNRLLSPVLQNIVGLTRAKAVEIFKMGISTIITRCKLGLFSRGRSHI